MSHAPIHHAFRRPSGRLVTGEFVLLGFATAVFFACAGAANALLPRFVVDELGGSETTAGVVMGSIALSSLVSRPWYGRVADRRGARRIMIVGGLVSAVGYAGLLPASTVAIAIASRLVVGAGHAGMFVGAAMLALQIAPPDRQSEAASYMLVSVHVGLGLGPVAGEAIRNAMSYDWAWGMIAALTAASSAIAMTLPIRRGGLHAETAPLISRSAIVPGFVALFGIFAFNGFLTFAPLYGREIGLDEVGLVFTVASFTIVIVRVLFGRVPDIIGPVRASTIALVITVMAAGVVAMWDRPVGMFIGGALLAVGISLQGPSFMALALTGVSDRERGAAMATYTGFFDIAQALVGPTIGLLVSGFSYRVAFLFSGCMAAVSIVLLYVLVAPRQRPA